MLLTDDELEARLAQQSLADLVRGDPELLHRIRTSSSDFRFAADAVGLEVLLPDLSTIPATEKFPEDAVEAAAPPQPPTTPFSRGTNGEFGSAYQPLSLEVERTKANIVADIEANTPESIARAEAGAMGLVAVARLYKHVEPRQQLMKLRIPGHEELVGFAIKHLLRAGGRLGNGKLADAGCKLLIGCSFDRLCTYDISEHFDKKGTLPPADAPLYGVGVAISAGPSPLSGLRVLLMLTDAERWLAAETVCALLGASVCGANDGSHTAAAASSPLRDAVLWCLSDPAAGELAGVLAASAVVGMGGRCEQPAAMMRAGLGGALVRGWRDESRPMTSALSAYALSDLCEQANGVHWRQALETSANEIEPPGHVTDVDSWWAQLRAIRLQTSEEYEAGVAILKEELQAAGLALPPSRRKWRGAEEAPAAEGAVGGPFPPTGEEAMAAAWEAIPALAHQKPSAPRDAWESYCYLCDAMEEHFRDQLTTDEPYLYNTFG